MLDHLDSVNYEADESFCDLETTPRTPISSMPGETVDPDRTLAIRHDFRICILSVHWRVIDRCVSFNGSLHISALTHFLLLKPTSLGPTTHQ